MMICFECFNRSTTATTLVAQVSRRTRRSARALVEQLKAENYFFMLNKDNYLPPFGDRWKDFLWNKIGMEDAEKELGKRTNELWHFNK